MILADLWLLILLIIQASRGDLVGQTTHADDRLEPAYRTAFVSQTFVDDTHIDDRNTHRFSTIQTAIDWVHDSSWYSDLDADNTAVIMVYPGMYREQLTCWEFIRIVSLTDHDNLCETKSVQLLIPDDKKTEPILLAGADYVYNITGLTINADSVENAPYLYATKEAHFFDCFFEYGSFEDGDGAYASDVKLIGCLFNSGTNAINYTGVRGHADRTIYMLNTWSYGDIIVNSTFATGSPTIHFKRCPMTGKAVVGGDWGFKISKSRMTNITGSPYRNTFDTTGIVDISDTTVSGGIHFTSNPSEIYLEHIDFNEVGATAITGADITADVNITNVYYHHNLQQNGIAGEIQTVDPIKHVGGDAIDRFYSLQDAIDSIAVKGVVDLRESLTGLAELIIPANTNVTIDGHKLYSLTFTGDVVELNANEQLVFFGLARIDGGNIEVNGNSSYIGFEECLTVAAYVTLTSGTGTYCLVYTSTIKGLTGHPAITLNNTDTVIVSGYSRIDGGTGHPAILITVEADGNIKLKFSTLIHGDNAANAPLIYTGANKVDISVYSCALNAVWDPADFTNLIGSPNNTADAQINF